MRMKGGRKAKGGVNKKFQVNPDDCSDPQSRVASSPAAVSLWAILSNQ